jgi:hypothetical protein
VWHILMGPENYNLDLFESLPVGCRRIVFLFDTLPSQLSLIRRLFSGPEWDVCITSFSDAIPSLEKETGRAWRHVDQAVTQSYFKPVCQPQRVIHFSAYGRRHARVHEAVLQFCRANDLYYDFTTHGRGQPTAGPLQLYDQFAWHMSHSLFTFCWPVETTSPIRAGELSPITCRWFEAAAAGAVILGQPPRNPRFRQIFGDSAVTQVNPETDSEQMIRQLDQIWRRREELGARAAELRLRLGNQLDWSERVEQMRGFI